MKAKFLPESEIPDSKGRFPLNRREFLKLAGGGIFIFFTVGDPRDWVEAQQRGAGRELSTDFNAFLRIAEDGSVTGFTGKAELGQGISTSLAQIAAEELDVPLDAVTMVLGDTAVCPWDMGTFGSRTIKYFGPPFRQAAAEAKAVLLLLASEQLRLPAGKLGVKDGVIFEQGNPENKISYGALAKGKIIGRHIEPKPPVKPIAEHTVAGKPAGRKDAALKATGKAEYAADIRLPGMLYARILRPPAHGAKMKSVDTSEAEKIEGARIIRDGDTIAVLHDSYDQADSVLSRIEAEWDVPAAAVDEENIYEHLVKVAPPGEVVEEKGNLEEGKKAAAREHPSLFTTFLITGFSPAAAGLGRPAALTPSKSAPGGGPEATPTPSPANPTWT